MDWESCESSPLILTHSDPDHVNGLSAFPKGLVIIAYANCKNEVQETLDGLGAAAPPALGRASRLPSHADDHQE